MLSGAHGWGDFLDCDICQDCKAQQHPVMIPSTHLQSTPIWLLHRKTSLSIPAVTSTFLHSMDFSQSKSPFFSVALDAVGHFLLSWNITTLGLHETHLTMFVPSPLVATFLSPLFFVPMPNGEILWFWDLFSCLVLS